MAGRTRGLIERALKQRQAAERAALVAADQAQAQRAAEEVRLGAEMARERDFAGLRASDGALLFGAVGAAWRVAAAGRLDAARHETLHAAAVCDAAHETLAETARAAKGIELLMERQDAERARREARRDPLGELMLLPR